MKTFMRWIRRVLGGQYKENEDINRALFNTFTSPFGEISLAYLIEEYMVNVSPVPSTGDAALVAMGKHQVVQDILSRMEIYRAGMDESVEVESGAS